MQGMRVAYRYHSVSVERWSHQRARACMARATSSPAACSPAAISAAACSAAAAAAVIAAWQQALGLCHRAGAAIQEVQSVCMRYGGTERPIRRHRARA